MLKKLSPTVVILLAYVLLNQCKTKNITQFPLEDHYDTIKIIDLSQVSVGSFPKKYLKYRNITTLNLSGLKISDTALHTIIKAYPKLTSLTLDDCDLKNLPSSIDSLKHLNYLSLVNNKFLIKIPQNISLQYLNIKGCNSLNNMNTINKFKLLTYLNLSETNIKEAELASYQLNKLLYLNISYTSIENIILTKNSFPKLVELDIRKTYIKDVKKIKSSYPKLKIIYTDNDSIKHQLKQTNLLKPYF